MPRPTPRPPRDVDDGPSVELIGTTAGAVFWAEALP